MSNLKKVVALALALALVMTMFAGATIKAKLPVVDADKFTAAQQEAAALLMPLGVLAGMGADELGAGTVTRAQMVAFIYRLINGGDTGVQAYYSKTSQYKDVDPEAWYAPYLNWAYAAKVAYGYTNGNFGPEDPVTGAQAAAMLVRLLGKDASGNDYALKAEANAIALQLDKGIETKGLYENALARGDMFILLANTLLVDVKGETLAEKYFDLEIVEGAILMGEDKIGSNNYTIFAFRLGTAGDVKWFWTDLLCTEDDSDVFDDYGCKFKLLVSKSQNVQGYRQLYAAYEEDQGKYYKVKSGTVDDGELIFSGPKQNVFYDDFCFFYVNGAKSTKEAFEASYGIANMARYKLIDNDGDNKYEFAIIERLRLSDIKTETVNAKVVAVNADGSVITLQKADGTEIKVTPGEFWTAKFEGIADNVEAIEYALGINQWDYMPYAAISDVYYDFVVAGGYIFGVNAASNTKFSGSYGILVAWSSPVTFYKNMPYALFMNESNDYFWAYVNTVDEAASWLNWTHVLDNSLIYFTDGDASDDVVSFDCAAFWNENYVYRYLWADDYWAEMDAGAKVTIPFNRDDGFGVVSKLCAKETYDYSKVAKFGSTYAVFDVDPADPAGDGSEPALQYWDVKTQSYVDLPAATLVDTSMNRMLNGVPMSEYKDLEGKYVVPVANDQEFYGIEDMDECLGFVYVADAEITVELAGYGDFTTADEFQIYRRNGFWHLRFYFTLDDLTADDVVIYWNDHYVTQDADGNWVIWLDDGTDPELESSAPDGAEGYRLAELVRGFNDAEFTAQITAAIDEFVNANKGGTYRSEYTILKIDAGVVFAYGSIVDNRNHDNDPRGDFGRVGTDALGNRWVAYDIKTFNSDFGLGDPGNDIVPFGNTADELIFTVLGNGVYVKALKVSDSAATHLPYGWIAPNGYELVVFGGYAGGVNTKGWGIKLVTISSEGIKDETVFTKIGLGGAAVGDVLLVKRDANGDIEELFAVGTDVKDYLSYAGFSAKLSGTGILQSATLINGNDARGDYFEISISGKTVYYIGFANYGADGDGLVTYPTEKFTYTTEFPKAWVGKAINIYTAGNFVFITLA